MSDTARYYLTGEKQGTSDIFIDNLPGYPDNIKSNSRGNFFVGMGSVRFEGSSPIGSFLDLIGPYPGLKKIIVAVSKTNKQKLVSCGSFGKVKSGVEYSNCFSVKKFKFVFG